MIIFAPPPSRCNIQVNHLLMEEISHCFPSDIFLIIVEYLDYGDPADGALFGLQPFLINHWLKSSNFQINQKQKSSKKFCISTTININGLPVLHSIEDQPAFIISKVPFEKLHTLPLDKKSIESLEAVEKIGNNFQIFLQDWGSFGYLDRANGKKPARQHFLNEEEEETNNFFYQYYFVKGHPRHPDDGPAMEAVGSGCGGFYYSAEWITCATNKAGELKKFRIKTKCKNSGYKKGISPFGKLHNVNGPAFICDDELPMKKWELGEDGCSDDGPPFAEHYLHGEWMTAAEHVAIVTK